MLTVDDIGRLLAQRSPITTIIYNNVMNEMYKVIMYNVYCIVIHLQFLQVSFYGHVLGVVACPVCFHPYVECDIHISCKLTQSHPLDLCQGAPKPTTACPLVCSMKLIVIYHSALQLDRNMYSHSQLCKVHVP